MKTKIILLLIAVLIFIFLFRPVSVTEPYYVTEQRYENYTVTEPKVVTVADLNKEDLNVSRNFSGTRLRYDDIAHESHITTCGNISYSNRVLAYAGWGKIFLLPYDGETYFAGYKGFTPSFYVRNTDYVLGTDTYTYTLSSRTGNVYTILRDELINVSLREGENYGFQGYNLQVNNIGKQKTTTTSCEANYGGITYEDNQICYSNTNEFHGAKVTLSIPGKSQTWDVVNGTNMFYNAEPLKGGESVPSILIHVKEVTNETVTLGAIFQISREPAQLGEIGAEVSVTITNTDSTPGTFEVYQGFILNSTTNFEIGKLSRVFLQPGESRSLTYTTSKNTESCRSYSRSISKDAIPEKFTEVHNVSAYKVKTQFRNVTLYVNVINTKLVEVNVTKYRNRTIPFIFKTLVASSNH
jgi:hypothetical protein